MGRGISKILKEDKIESKRRKEERSETKKWWERRRQEVMLKKRSREGKIGRNPKLRDEEEQEFQM